MRSNVIRDASAVIRDDHKCPGRHPLPVIADSGGECGCADADLSARRDGFGSVCNEVGEDLAEFSGERIDDDRRRKIGVDGDA